jgi:hypothetical protein
MAIQRRARPEYSRVFAAGFLAREADERERAAAGRPAPARDEFARDEPERERDDFVPEAMV